MTKTREEAINMLLEQVAFANKFHPETGPEMVFHRRYCIALYWRPDGTLPCHAWQEENPRNTLNYIYETNMKTHRKMQHSKDTIKCSEQNCIVLFNSLADKELHELYCHKKSYGVSNISLYHFIAEVVIPLPRTFFPLKSNNYAFHVIGSSGH
ncbi:hypothetical protein ACQJBY_073453 [Aegilops geniculata]